MQEIKRWIFNTRIWLILLLVNIVSVFGFVRIQTSKMSVGDLKTGAELAGYMLDEYLRAENSEVVASYAYLQYEGTASEAYAYSVFADSASRLEDYQSYLARVQGNVQSMMLLGAMNDENEFSGKNIKKTGEDFSGLADVTWTQSVTLSAEKVLGDSLLDYCLLSFLLLVVVQFYGDRKNGMWTLSRCYVNGRLVSTVKCCIALLLWTVIGCASLYITAYAAGTYIYGATDLSLPIQALDGYEGVTLKLNALQFSLLSMAIKSLGFFVMAGFMWLVFMLLDREITAILVILAALGAEKLLYQNISYQSSVNVFKAFNIWAVTTCDDLLKVYQNLNLFGAAVSTKTAVLIFAALLLVIVYVLVLTVNTRQYPRLSGEGRISAYFQKLVSKILVRGGYGRLEQYKIWSCQKGFLFGIVFIVLLASSISNVNISYGSRDAYRNQVLEDISDGDLTYARNRIAELNGELEDTIAEYNQQLEALDDEDYFTKSSIQELISATNTKLDVLDSLTEYVSYLEEKESQGYNVEPVNDNGYQMLFTVSGKTMQRQLSFYLLLFIVVLCSGSMAYENQKNTTRLVHACEAKNRALFRSKVRAYHPFVVIAAIATSLIEIYNINSQIGLSGIGLDIQSLEMFSGCRLHISIFHLILLIIAEKVLICRLIMTFTLWVSGRFNKMATAMAFLIIILVLPSFLVLCGLSILKPISLMEYLCVQQWFTKLFM